MKQITFIFIFVFISTCLFSQETKDIVYLKNGSVIKGEITEMIPNEHIKIKTADGSLFVYSFTEIEKTEKQEIAPTFRNVKGKNVTTAQNNIDNVFYFRLGYSSPSWKQFGGTEEDFEGFNKSGAMFELGKIYMLNRIPLPENMAIGINADFISFYWHRFSSEEEDVDLGTLRAESKIGPSFTFIPKYKLAVDVYAKAVINWLTATAIVYDDNADDAEGYGKFGTFGFSTGLNVRYSKLMLGVEFNTISPKLESIDYDGEYLGNFNDNSTDKSPLPSLSFTIGMAF